MRLEDLLKSEDTSEIIDALYKLGSKQYAVTSEVIDVLARLVVHPDADVRETAASTALRLRLPELHPVLMTQLREAETEPSVLPPLIDAVTALALHGTGDRRELSKILGGYVLDEHQDEEVRQVAYLSLLKLWDKITPREYAVAPQHLSEMAWDKGWVQSLLEPDLR